MRHRARLGRRERWLALAVSLLWTPLALRGMSTDLVPPIGTSYELGASRHAVCTPPPVQRAVWPAPLDRSITVRGGETTLRDALDRAAAAGQVHLTYSDARLALERRVCLEFGNVPLGDVLTTLIGSVSVVPRAVSAALVVLAPDDRTPPSSSTARFSIAPRAAPLERVVVTGTATGGAQRPLTVSVGVIDGTTLDALGVGTVSEAVNGLVPGLWVWQQSPMAVTARYASVRGASSFGVSYPKVYIDGIEVANPLVVTHVPAESIERLEVLRGPQGAALYGTDAISGVVHMVTRQPSSADASPALRVRANSAIVNSAYTESGALGQEVTVAGQRGDVTRAMNGSISYSRLGAFLPAGQSDRVSAAGRLRLIGERSVLDGSLRLGLANVAESSNPIVLAALRDAIVVPDSIRARPSFARLRDSIVNRLQLHRTQAQSLSQLTAGLTGTIHPSARWTHRATLGVDTYALDGTPSNGIPLPSSSDSALRAAEGSATRTSVRVSSTARDAGPIWSRTLTLAAEHAVLREATSNDVLANSRLSLDTGAVATVWRHTTGAMAQLDLAWHDQWFLTGGARVERSAGFTDQPLLSLLPMLGSSYVLDMEPVTLKLRGAYGKGIRPPRITVGGTTIARQRMLANPFLEPEEQAGTELGADLFWGRRATLHVTRFDQRASGLVQPVVVLAPSAVPGSPRPGDPLGRNLALQMQNVGAIDNGGWEMEGTLRSGPLLVQGSLTLVSSRVRDVRRGYTGELRPGDRMLDVPARTMGLLARWIADDWSASVQLSRASDWIGYDRIAASAVYVTPDLPASTLVGASLRQFWMQYPGVTRVNAVFTHALPRQLTLQLAGSNLLNVQVGEPDNITIVPGRSLSLGIRARF